MIKEKEEIGRGILGKPLVLLGIIILIAILLVNTQPGESLIGGKATAFPFIGVIEGDWKLTEITDHTSCGGEIETVEFVATFTQANNHIKIALPELLLRSDVLLVGNLLDNNLKVKGIVIDGPTTIDLDYNDLTISPDCKTLEGTGKFKATPKNKNICTGPLTVKATRIGDKDCGVPNVCVEDWSCGEWSECVEGTQTRTCSGASSCGTENSKPSEIQSCTILAGEPKPAPDINYVFVGLIFAALLILASIIYLFTILFNKKKRLASDLDYLLEKIYSSLNARDKFSALEHYKELTEKFEKYKGKISEKDARRIYDEAVEANKEILRR